MISLLAGGMAFYMNLDWGDRKERTEWVCFSIGMWLGCDGQKWMYLQHFRQNNSCESIHVRARSHESQWYIPYFINFKTVFNNSNHLCTNILVIQNVYSFVFFTCIWKFFNMHTFYAKNHLIFKTVIHLCMIRWNTAIKTFFTQPSIWRK